MLQDTNAGIELSHLVPQSIGDKENLGDVGLLQECADDFLSILQVPEVQDTPLA